MRMNPKKGTMPSEQEFQKQLKRRERHSLRFVIRCDVVNPELIEREPYHGWRATISAAPPDGLFLQTLVVTPHSTGGRKLCAALNAGDILHFRLQWNIFRCRIAYKDVSGEIRLAAADLGRELICPVRMADDDNPICKVAPVKPAR
jgi:hypothetical protein